MALIKDEIELRILAQGKRLEQDQAKAFIEDAVSMDEDTSIVRDVSIDSVDRQFWEENRGDILSQSMRDIPQDLGLSNYHTDRGMKSRDLAN